MTRTRLGLLGLCAMVFGLMAFGATAAQAETNSKWLILNASGELKTGSELHAAVELEHDTDGILHSKIAGIAVLFECKVIKAVNVTLQANGSTNTGGKIKFSECITKLNGKTESACEPNAGGKEKGVINTNSGHGLLVLHKLGSGEVDDLVLILPDTGETFATIEMGEECAIGEKVPVIGHATLKDCVSNANFLKHEIKHLIEVGPLTELWTISKTAEHVATILGSAWAFLEGAHVGLKWSGDPA